RGGACASRVRRRVAGVEAPGRGGVDGLQAHHPGERPVGETEAELAGHGLGEPLLGAGEPVPRGGPRSPRHVQHTERLALGSERRAEIRGGDRLGEGRAGGRGPGGPGGGGWARWERPAGARRWRSAEQSPAEKDGGRTGSAPHVATASSRLSDGSRANSAPASVGKRLGASRPTTLYASSSVKHDCSSSPIWFSRWSSLTRSPSCSLAPCSSLTRPS